MFNIYTKYLIREALDDGKGIHIKGQRIANTRYADDTIIMAESEQLRTICNGSECQEYKRMIVEKTPGQQCEVNVKGQRLTHKSSNTNTWEQQ